MKRFTQPDSLFVCAFAAMLITYVWIMVTKTIPTGDETISYLSATGNQEAYEQVRLHQDLYGKLTSATDWQKFFQSKPGSFKNIAPELTKTDLHPPLYFWLLHVWLFLPIPLFVSGVVLNLLLHILSALVLLQIGKQLQFSQSIRLLALLLWCLSPAILPVGFQARQYELLGLFHLAMLWSYLQFVQQAKTKYIILFAVFTLGGMLTQYLMLYFVFAYVAYAMLIKRNPKQAAYLLLAILSSLMLLWLIHPGVVDQFLLQQHRAQNFNWNELPLRTGKVVLAFVQLLFPVLQLKSMWMKLSNMMVLMVIGLLPLVVFLLGYFNRKKLLQLTILMQPSFIGWFLFCAIVLAVVPYLLFLTPQHAMGGHYLMLVYPLIAYFIAIQIEKINWHAAWFLLLLCIGMLFYLNDYARLQHQGKQLLSKLNQQDMILVNSVDRRGFLRVVPYLTHQRIIMDEQLNPCAIQEIKKIAWTDQATARQAKPYLNASTQTFDLTDGVEVSLTDSFFCASLPSLSK